MQAVVNIAAARHMTTTAEGVETRQQMELLRALGCAEMQGYFFSPPCPAAEIKKLLFAHDGRTGPWPEPREAAAAPLPPPRSISRLSSEPPSCWLTRAHRR